MTEPEIADAITRLRAEINTLDTNNVETREKLESLLENLEQNLHASEDEDVHLMDEMKEAISQFEVEHPRVTGIINDIMIALGNLGI